MPSSSSSKKSQRRPKQRESDRPEAVLPMHMPHVDARALSRAGAAAPSEPLHGLNTSVRVTCVRVCACAFACVTAPATPCLQIRRRQLHRGRGGRDGMRRPQGPGQPRRRGACRLVRPCACAAPLAYPLARSIARSGQCDGCLLCPFLPCPKKARCGRFGSRVNLLSTCGDALKILLRAPLVCAVHRRSSKPKRPQMAQTQTRQR